MVGVPLNRCPSRRGRGLCVLAGNEAGEKEHSAVGQDGLREPPVVVQGHQELIAVDKCDAGNPWRYWYRATKKLVRADRIPPPGSSASVPVNEVTSVSWGKSKPRGGAAPSAFKRPARSAQAALLGVAFGADDVELHPGAGAQYRASSRQPEQDEARGGDQPGEPPRRSPA